MKRFISLLLTVLLLLTSVNTLVFAAVKEKTLNAASDIYSLVDGEGFYDNKSAQGRRGLEIDGTSVVLRQKEWICYDISDLEGGVYKLSINRGVKNPVTVAVEIDGTEVLSNISVTSSGDYSTPSDFEFGEIALSGSQEKLKIKNTTTNRAMYVNTITLKKLDPLTFKSFSSNADAESDVVARGADSFTITMSADLNPDTVKNETVMIKDSDGNALDANVSANGSVITLNLKESLDFEEEYTLVIDGVKALNGQSMVSAVNKVFKTADRTNMSGTAFVEVTSFEAEDGTLVASGCVKSSAGLGISGRDVRLFTKGENGTEETLATESVSGENGFFTISYTMPENSEAGKYEVIITSDYVNDTYENSMFYFSKALGEEIKSEFSDLTELSDVESAVETYKDYLGVDMEWAETVIADFDKVYGALVGKSFDDAESVINTFKEAVYSEAIIQTEDADVLIDVLDDENKSEYVSGFKASLWALLNASGKLSVAEKTMDFEPSGSETLASFLNSEIKAQLISQLGLENFEITFESDEIMTGKTAEIKVSIDKAISDVKSMHFELAYEEKSAGLFENDGITVEGLKGFSYEAEVKDSVLYIDLTASETTSVSGDFMTLKIPASGKAGGVHTAVVSGYILYHPEIITDEDENLSVDFTVNENPTVTVNVVKSMTIKAPDVINLIEGDGFHNEASLGGKDGLDVSGNTVIYRNGEWGDYDISALIEGDYEVSVLFSSNAGTTFATEAEGKTTSKTLASSGGYNVYVTKVIGKIELSGAQKRLKFKNNGPGAAYVEKIILERLDEPEFVGVSTNTGISDGITARGADRFIINMSVELDKDTVTNDTVTIKNSDGTALLADVSVAGKVITLKLKESLEFSENYKLLIDGVKAANGQLMKAPVSYEFETADRTDMCGTAYIEITSFETKNGKITAEGVIKSSVGTPVSGRDVILFTKGEDETEESRVAYVTSGENGVFTISYSIPENSETKRYEVKITSDYVSAPYENSMLYFSKMLAEEMIVKFSGLVEISDVASTVGLYKDYLGVDMEWAMGVISDFDKVYDDFLNESFEDTETILNTIKAAVYSEAIVQTEDKDVVVGILDDEEKNKNIDGFKASLWSVLEKEGKDSVANGVIDFVPSDSETLASYLNKAIKAQLISQFGLTQSEINFSSAEIMSDEKAEIIASIDKEISDVCGVHFEFAYNEESAGFFETDRITIEGLSGFSYETEVIDNVLHIDLKADKKASVSGDFMTVIIPASGKAGGKHLPVVSGYVIYHPEAIADESENLSVDFTVKENPSVTVNLIKSMTIKAPDVINLIEGDGFHDETQNTNGDPSLEFSGSGIVYRQGDWAKYDISALSAGKYQVSAQFASTANTNHVIEVDGKKIALTVGATSVSYEKSAVAVYGLIELSGNQDNLKFLNNSLGSVILREIYIIRADAPKINEFRANAGVSDGIIPRGTDHFDIIYNNALNEVSVNANTVTVKDKDGKAVSLEVVTLGETISVDIKETLDFDKEYTITIDGVSDKFGQSVSDKITLKTDSQDISLNSSSIDIDTWKVSGKEFKAEGRILSSGGVGIKGRKIKLSTKAPNEKEYIVWAEGVSGDDGKFSLSYTFAENDISGKYAIVLDYEYAQTPYKNVIYYFDRTLSDNLKEEFSNLADKETVISKLDENADVLGINLDEIKENVNISFIADKMVEKTYASASDVVDDINMLYALEKVNQAMDENVIQSLIESEDALKDIGEIQRNKWNELTDEEQKNIAKSIKEGGRIEEPSLLIEKIDELINEELMANYPVLNSAAVSVNSAAVNVGQSADLNFTASAKQENVVAVCIELEYTEGEAKLFEEAVSYTLSKDLKDLSVNKFTEDGKLKFVISVAQNTKGTIKKVSFRNDIITLSFKAPSGAEGSYNPKVSGYITYHADTDEAHQTDSFFVDIPFEVAENPVITVNKIKESGGKDYSGGGGASGGNSYGTQSSGGNVIPPVTNEGINVDSAFTDIDNVAWAKDSIEALALKGIVNGRGDGTFAPNDSVTRAEFCKMITSAFGVVNNDAVCEFTDVPSGSWFYTYVASAKAAGFVNGKTETDFAPGDTITREEMAAIALRAIGIAEDKEKTLFADDTSISEYAKGAVYTLKNLGILDGVGDNMFAPRGVVTRAMAAKVIYALITA